MNRRQFQVAVCHLDFDSIRPVGVDTQRGQFVGINPHSGPDGLTTSCMVYIRASYIIFIIIAVVFIIAVVSRLSPVVSFVFTDCVRIDTPAVTYGRRVGVSRLFRAIFLLEGIN